MPRRAREYGGKARSLSALARGGFPVPSAYALPASASAAFYAAVLPEADRPSSLLKDTYVAPERLRAIAERVRTAPLPFELRRGLGEAFRALREEGAASVAVRSSSTREDQDEASAAGLHETVLDVRDVVALEDAVRHCWASTFAPRVLTYLRELGAAEDPDAAVGIVVQTMVPAEVAGVLFTVNPLTGDAGEIVINASYGLGALVVDGAVSPDTIRVDKASAFPRERVVGAKETRLVLAPEGGTEVVPVPEELRSMSALGDEDVAALPRLALRVEEHFDGPRDVEWALSGGELQLLQARPVTVALQPGTRRWQRRRGEEGDRSRLVWSNLNVGEALPGVATPLTWSFLSGFSELGFRRALGSVGCTVPKDAELVGSFRGRIYLNLSELLGLLSQVPGLRPRTLLALGGGGEVERLEAEIEGQSSLAFFARLPLTATRFARENFRVGEKVTEFERSFASERARLVSLDPRVLPPSALAGMLADVERLLDHAGAIMLTVYGNLLASAVALHSALRLAAGDRAEALQRDLLTGIADLDSAAPGLRLWHIAEMARGEDAVRETLLGHEDVARLRLEDLPEGPTRRALSTFLRAHGHRGTREAEIAAPRWREDPTVLFATLAIHLRRSAETAGPLDIERRLRAVREAAERELRGRVPAIGRPAFRHLLALVKRFLRLRERLRGYVTEVLGLFRIVALDASRRLAVREPSAGPDAAFFLTITELYGVLRGSGVRVALRVQQRRRQHERDVALPDPPDTFVGYPPPAELGPVEAGQGTLVGLAASSGVAEGRARVLVHPADAADFQPGEILVASCADVGWSPLFLVAGAVVTDLGGPLSHAAIVLREYGVPAVVNAKHATRALRTGDWVRVDGSRGTVESLAPADA